MCLVYIDDEPTSPGTTRRGTTTADSIRTKFQDTKCFFGRQTSNLRQVVTEHEVLVDPKKVEAVAAPKTPIIRAVVRSLLRLSSYYQKFISDYARVARPLTRLLRDDERFQLSSTPILLQTDAYNNSTRQRRYHKPTTTVS